MATTAEDVLKEAFQPSEGEREPVAAELLASLEPDVEAQRHGLPRWSVAPKPPSAVFPG